MQSLYNSVIQSVQPLRLHACVPLYVCVSALAHLKRIGETHEVLTQWFYSVRNHNEVSLHVFQHLCENSISKEIVLLHLRGEVEVTLDMSFSDILLTYLSFEKSIMDVFLLH